MVVRVEFGRNSYSFSARSWVNRSRTDSRWSTVDILNSEAATGFRAFYTIVRARSRSRQDKGKHATACRYIFRITKCRLRLRDVSFRVESYRLDYNPRNESVVFFRIAGSLSVILSFRESDGIRRVSGWKDSCRVTRAVTCDLISGVS